METIKFELPSKLWKFTKIYSTNGVEQQHLKLVKEIEEVIYFKSTALAEDYYSRFTWGYTEEVIIEDTIYNLEVITNLIPINTLDLIPKVIDL
jgi:hypothetical protein